MNEHRPTASGAVDRHVRPLEPTGTELQQLLSVAVSYVRSVVDTLPATPVSDHRDLAAVLTDPALRKPPPESVRSLAEVLHDLDRAGQSASTQPARAVWRTCRAAVW